MVVPVDTPEDHSCVVYDNAFRVDFLEGRLWWGEGDFDGKVVRTGIIIKPRGEGSVVVSDVPGVTQEDCDVDTTVGCLYGGVHERLVGVADGDLLNED